MSQQENNKKKITGRIFNALGALSVLGICLWIVSYMGYFNNNEETDDAQVEGYITPINTRIGGYIREVRVQEHSPVKKEIHW